MSLKRSAIFVHRWLGVALCLVFLLWFPTGIVMMYWDFPSVTAADRLERSPALNAANVRVSAADALATLDASFRPTQVRLNTFDGRPAYRFRSGREEAIVYADTGERQRDVSNSMMDRVASAWTGRPASDATIHAIDVDQWTVQGSFRNLKPIWKYSWPNGEQVYVSQASGEVEQYTTTASRLGAYLGAIPHWLYFTPLRKHQPEWSRVVIWSSGIGTFAASLGIIIGIWMYSPAKRYRRAGVPTGIPYRGQKRWHAILGLIFGLGAATWAFSGMLSMDPFPTKTSGPTGGRNGNASAAISQALRNGLAITAFASKDPRVALAQVRDLNVKELEFTSFAGEPFYIATLGRADTRIIPVNGALRAEFDRRRIAEVVTKAAGPGGLAEVLALERYDRYYIDRHRQRPLPVILVCLNDADHTRYYIDPKTARIVGSYTSRNWMTRWLYHGLHSLDFPWLYNHRPLWDIVVITFMLGGTALCVTSVILAWRVVGRTLTGYQALDAAMRVEQLGDDLAVDGVE
ncbi:MAG: PepSY domain-containing protein [Acidobacteria bacterium]|nr:PepSY domain-containing protein [Acidobacteriota bacterium]